MIRRSLLIAAAALAFASAANAAPPVNTLKASLFGGRTDTAISGYDTVAYFTDGKPIPGSDAYTYVWKGAKWKFASQAHLEMFKADPTKFAPQYGGYCAYGVAHGNLVKVEPDSWTVVDGKLYLNFNKPVQWLWSRDPKGFITDADSKFDELLKK